MRESSLAGEMSTAGKNRPGQAACGGRKWIWAGFVVLFVFHHDFWWWDDRTLVLGFLPIGLAYHATFSVAAGFLWALANRYAWPGHLEEWASGAVRAEQTTGSGDSHGEGQR